MNKNSILSQNFRFINDQTELISDLFSQIDFKFSSHPTHFVVDKEIKVLAFLSGGLQNEDDGSKLANFINQLTN